jgi:hypothetical protein
VSSTLPTSSKSLITLLIFAIAKPWLLICLPLSFKTNLTRWFSAKNSLALLTLCCISPSPIPNERLSCLISLFLDLALAADSFFLSSYKNLLKSRILATGGVAVSTNKTKSRPSSSAFFKASALVITP